MAKRQMVKPGARDSRAKFIELAVKRVNRAIKDMRLIGNLSNRRNYSYSKAEVDRIFQALDNEVRTLKRRFEEKGTSRDQIFSLKD